MNQLVRSLGDFWRACRGLSLVLGLAVLTTIAPNVHGQSEPPPVTLTVGGLDQRAGLGSSCWAGMCRDIFAIVTPDESIDAGAGSTATVRMDIGIEPVRVDIRAYRASGPAPEVRKVGPGQWVPDAEGTIIPSTPATTQTIQLPRAPGLYVLSMLAAWEGELRGDAFYGFLISIQADDTRLFVPIALKNADVVHGAPTAAPTDVPSTPPIFPPATPSTGPPTATPSPGTSTPVPSPTLEPLPTPMPEEDEPWADMELGGSNHRAFLGTHCWRHGCADYIGLMTPAEPIQVGAGITATLRIGPTPDSMVLQYYAVTPGPEGDEVGSGDGWRAWRPSAEPIDVPVEPLGEQEIVLPAETGLYAVSIWAVWDGSGPDGHRGDAQLGFLVEVDG